MKVRKNLSLAIFLIGLAFSLCFSSCDLSSLGDIFSNDNGTEETTNNGSSQEENGSQNGQGGQSGGNENNGNGENQGGDNSGSGENSGTITYPSEMSALERAVFDEMNLVRKNPKSYAEQYIKPMVKQFNGNIFTGYGYNLQTNEGVKAVNECITDLSNQNALPAFIPSKGLTLASQEWVSIQGKTTETGHAKDTFNRISKYGTYYSAAENIAYSFDEVDIARRTIVQLLIDDGVDGRGHRKNILGNFTHAGVGCGSHKTFKICV